MTKVPELGWDDEPYLAAFHDSTCSQNICLSIGQRAEGGPIMFLVMMLDKNENVLAYHAMSLPEATNTFEHALRVIKEAGC